MSLGQLALLIFFDAPAAPAALVTSLSISLITLGFVKVNICLFRGARLVRSSDLRAKSKRVGSMRLPYSTHSLLRPPFLASCKGGARFSAGDGIFLTLSSRGFGWLDGMLSPCVYCRHHEHHSGCHKGVKRRETQPSFGPSAPTRPSSSARRSSSHRMERQKHPNLHCPGVA